MIYPFRCRWCNKIVWPWEESRSWEAKYYHKECRNIMFDMIGGGRDNYPKD